MFIAYWLGTLGSDSQSLLSTAGVCFLLPAFFFLVFLWAGLVYRDRPWYGLATRLHPFMTWWAGVTTRKK